MLIDERIRGKLEGLTLHTAGFRQAFDRIFVSPCQTGEECLNYFGSVLLFASQLYADYVSLTFDLARLEVPEAPVQVSRADRAATFPNREGDLRNRCSAVLRAMPCWGELDSNAPFGKITGLQSPADYIERLALHLPEIYEESIRVEGWANGLGAGSAATTLGPLVVGLEHMGRNHLLFALPALQFAADETSWNF